jgi:hypothetical protein
MTLPESNGEVDPAAADNIAGPWTGRDDGILGSYLYLSSVSPFENGAFTGRKKKSMLKRNLHTGAYAVRQESTIQNASIYSEIGHGKGAID